MREYRIGRLKGRFVVTWIDDHGKRRRFRLAALTRKEAEAEGLDVIRHHHARPTGYIFADLVPLYLDAKAGRSIATTIGYTSRAFIPHFGALRPDQITTQDCRDYARARTASGKTTGTVWTELGHVRMICSWAQREGLIERAPYIELPPKPAPRNRYLANDEIARLLAADAEPHIRLAILLMLTTAARVGAVLELTWDRVDLVRGQIDLRKDAEGPRKGRAVVPINNTLRAALEQARQAALSDHVIEWAGEPVRSIRTGFARTVAGSGLEGVTPHVLRHTAAVHMAAAGIPMPKISQYLGHSNTAVTERVYARFAPGHLADAAAALEFGQLRVVK